MKLHFWNKNLDTTLFGITEESDVPFECKYLEAPLYYEWELGDDMKSFLNYDWEIEAKRKHPFLFKIYQLRELFLGVSRKIKNIKYTFLSYISPANVIKIPSLSRYYNDPDVQILHHNFYVMEKFLEDNILDYEEENTKANIDKMKALNEWWQEYKVSNDRDVDKEDEMLTELIKIRRNLWD